MGMGSSGGDRRRSGGVRRALKGRKWRLRLIFEGSHCIASAHTLWPDLYFSWSGNFTIYGIWHLRSTYDFFFTDDTPYDTPFAQDGSALRSRNRLAGTEPGDHGWI